MNDTNKLSAQTIVFSCLGHLYIHMFTAFYFVIVLALEVDWHLPYHELIELWTLGALMVGVAALPAGMLGDRLGAPVMMIIFFVGMGLCSIGAGLTDSPLTLTLWLTGIGVFAAIYHPVGIPWLVRNTGSKKGKALGFNGIFGSLGGAIAGVTTGFFIDSVDWRAAFIVPGTVCAFTGFALIFFVAHGQVGDTLKTEQSVSESNTQSDMVRVFGVLLITMFIAGIIYNTTQIALPKVFAERHEGLAGEGVFGIGLLVAFVYTAGGVMQFLGGLLADRLSLKMVYVSCILIQVPLLWSAAVLGGIPLLFVTTFMVMANAGALPAENMLLARYTPAGRHGLVFGFKFVLAFGSAPLALDMVAWIIAMTGEFYWVFTTLTVCAVCSLSAAVFLPPKHVRALPEPSERQ